jgi:hypothetical protein
VSDRIGAQIKLFLHDKHLFMTVFHKYTPKKGGICWEALEDNQIQTGPCNSIEKEQPFCFHVSKSKQRRMQRSNMLFVTNATRNIQKLRRDQEVVFSVKMS